MTRRSARRDRRDGARERPGRDSRGERPSPDAAPPRWPGRHTALIVACAILLLAAAVRLRLADVPLERDEGEYAYAGQLILQGIPPYQLAYNMKFPGTYYAYAAILALFGQTSWGIHVGLLLANAATALLLFFLGRRLLGEPGAVVAVAAFALLSLDRFSLGVFAHATHFVALSAVAGLLVLLRAQDQDRAGAYLAAGALFGVAVLMKQHAVAFLPLAIGLELWRESRRPVPSRRAMLWRSGLLIAGAVAAFMVVCAALAAQGVLGRFWFWTFQYASAYVTQVPLSVGWSLFLSAWRTITGATLPVWVFAAAGAVALWATPWKPETRVVLTGWLAASFLALCPGLLFREHYFIVLLPAAALLAGVAASSLARGLRGVTSPGTSGVIAAAVFVAVALIYVATEHRYLFSMTPRELSRSLYGANPFVEAPELARYIRAHTTPQDRVVVVGSEPEIYFYADRKSATGYIYTYPLTERHRYARRMQDEMIGEIEAARPPYLVMVGVPTSLVHGSSPDLRIVRWVERYVAACYERVGVVEIRSMHTTVVRWDADAVQYQPRPGYAVHTFRRAGEAACTAPREGL
jgi:4-amino-4-deoxy-L-arabinose transferase-like glycosyltransferase